MRLSLTGPWTVAVLAIATAAACGVVMGSLRAKHSWFRLLASVLGWIVASLLVDLVTSGQLFDTQLPWSVYLWITTPVVAMLVGSTSWRATPPVRRAMIPIAVAASALLGGSLLDRWFGYYPTLGSLIESAPSSSLGSALELRETHRGGGGRDVPSGNLALAGVVGADAQGKLVDFDPPATTSHFAHRSGFAWLPPAWFAGRGPNLPVVIYMSGVPGTTDDWIRAAGIVTIADAWQRTHHGEAPIMVFPDINGSRLNDTECVDGPHGNASSYLSRDVPDWILAKLDPSTDPRKWAVAGLSEGGTCALDLTLAHPDRFRTFVDLSGDLAPNLGGAASTLAHLWGGDRAAMNAADPSRVMATHNCSEINGWFEAGSSDRRGQRALTRLMREAQRCGMRTATMSRAGGHNYRFWKAAAGDMYGWLATSVGL